MCGICGIANKKEQVSELLINNMTKVLSHRGPDNISTELFNDNLLGLGHARLSIIDLSMSANQPMSYKHLKIVFNGEIYNFTEIRNELMLLGHSFVYNSDTEVILHAYDEWGRNCVHKFIGMFVFVIYNTNNNKLVCIRDRAGVKPFYYYLDDDQFMFASELKSFFNNPSFKKDINFSAVDQYMKLGYIPTPNCIFKGCKKMKPGHILEVDLETFKLTEIKYWDLADFYEKPRLDISYNEAKDKLKTLFISSFNYRMVADVPVGVFLSGGYDSTLVASVLQSTSKVKIKTFTIGFDTGNNEAPEARKIANHLGTEHTEYYCTEKEAKEIIPKLPFYFDEPFADSSAIPTILVSRLAKKDVTVALSADGGDELFAGYNRYDSFLRNMVYLNKIPNYAKNIFSILFKIIGKIIPSKYQLLRLKLSAFSELLKSNINNISAEVFWKSLTQTANPYCGQMYTNDFTENKDYLTGDYSKFHDDLSIPLCIDYNYYLENDIMVKVDRATMSASLEGREPLLDHRIAEFAAQLPNEFKYNKNIKKKILKDIVHDYVPYELMNRPKSGFSIPIYDWLKSDLSYLIKNNLSEEIVIDTGVFTVDYVRSVVSAFEHNKLYDKSQLWKLLQFHMWSKEWM